MSQAHSSPEVAEAALKKRVLLVDDDPKLLAATQRVLEGAGHHVVPCESGDAALAVLGAGAFDVMVSDVQMPGMTGLKLLRAVREHDLELPVVLMTGAPGMQSAVDAIEYGAFRYLIKPVPAAELRAVVSRAAAIGQVARSRREYVEEFASGRFRIGDRAGADAVLDRAIASLWTAYQPIVRAADSSIFAYEALLRVEEPLLPHPGAILAAAERAARIHDVGRAVRDSVVIGSRTAKDDWLLFVNLHPEDLMDETLFLPDTPFTAIAKRVVLEVTERASLDHISELASRVTALRALGFQIALDDLGAGYAGLTSFAQLEPEFVKLDMSLIRDVDKSSTKRKVIRSMVCLCQDMGKCIIAEGIERVEERDVLIELGCDLLQGYLFAKPGRPFPSVNTVALPK
ncbi:MAG TPA: EAL domain-containing protein [Polyangiaceae bacterium]|jgi:EAL domain-containing protein (putative c-di-GMP-specific phosphodiesterase class I)/CheY-like chemotaxis protein|nr:EAL domain-containing protein [Polyangiaceae bacterium]